MPWRVSTTRRTGNSEADRLSISQFRGPLEAEMLAPAMSAQAPAPIRNARVGAA